MSKRDKRRRKRKLSYAQKEFLERAGYKNRHHIQNKSQGGDWSKQNILILDARRHSAWHLLFKNKNFHQVIDLLKRTIAMKRGVPLDRVTA